MKALVVTALLAAVALPLGCIDDQFHCTSGAECVLSSTAGRCEATGFCSFPDPRGSCASGFRYGMHAPSNLADRCVESSPSDGSPGDGLNPDGPLMNEDLVAQSDFGTDCSLLSAGLGTTVTQVTPGHDGNVACLLCDTGGFSVVNATFSAFRTPTAGRKYKLELWARGDGTVGPAAGITVDLADVCESTLSTNALLGTNWQQLEDTTIAPCVTPDIGTLHISAYGGAEGACIVVDGLRLISVP